MRDKEKRDCWNERRQIFFHHGKAYRATVECKTVCLGNEADIVKAPEGHIALNSQIDNEIMRMELVEERPETGIRFPQCL